MFPYRDENETQRTPFVTFIMIAANVLAWVFVEGAGSPGAKGDRDAKLLAACYWNSLALAVEHNLSSIEFPSISTGAYGYPREEAAAVSSKAIEDFLTADKTLKEVRLVFYSLGDATLFLQSNVFTNGL
jgi:O-acetyl-ADP-ribose deacetylase (regulator of RNase III)